MPFGKRVIYVGPIYTLSLKMARRKYSADLDLTIRICSAFDALWSCGHPRPYAFIVECLNSSTWSARRQGWSIQDVQTRLRVFENRLPEFLQEWPPFAAAYVAIFAPDVFREAKHAYFTGTHVQFFFRNSLLVGRRLKSDLKSITQAVYAKYDLARALPLLTDFQAPLIRNLITEGLKQKSRNAKYQKALDQRLRPVANAPSILGLLIFSIPFDGRAENEVDVEQFPGFRERFNSLFGVRTERS
jgi:hypothetical protein